MESNELYDSDFITDHIKRFQEKQGHPENAKSCRYYIVDNVLFLYKERDRDYFTDLVIDEVEKTFPHAKVVEIGLNADDYAQNRRTLIVSDEFKEIGSLTIDLKFAVGLSDTVYRLVEEREYYEGIQTEYFKLWRSSISVTDFFANQRSKELKYKLALLKLHPTKL